MTHAIGQCDTRALFHKQACNHSKRHSIILPLILPFALCASSALAASGHFSKPQNLTPPQNRQTVSGQRIAVNGSGQMIAVWQQANQLLARIFANGSWGPVTAITQAADSAALFDLAESSPGQGLVVFSLTSGGQTSAQYSFYAA